MHGNEANSCQRKEKSHSGLSQYCTKTYWKWLPYSYVILPGIVFCIYKLEIHTGCEFEVLVKQVNAWVVCQIACYSAALARTLSITSLIMIFNLVLLCTKGEGKALFTLFTCTRMAVVTSGIY